MDTARLKELLEQFSASALAVVQKGQALLLVDDASLSLGSPDAPNVLVFPDAYKADDASALRQVLLDHVDELIDCYYRTHPLTWTGFDRLMTVI
jgi:hypothetical protein